MRLKDYRSLTVGLCIVGGFPLFSASASTRIIDSDEFPGNIVFAEWSLFKHQQDSTVLGRTVNLTLNNASAESAVRAIEKQLGVRVWYRRELLAKIPAITIKQGTTLTVRAFFDRLLANTKLNVVVVDGGEIAIVERGKSFQKDAIDSTGSIRGKVSDAKSGEVLPGVTVLLSGTSIRTMTDGSGGFVLKDVPGGTYSLQVQSLGFAPSRTQVTLRSGADTSIALSVDRATTTLSEVVTTATGVRERVEVANDITTIDVPAVLATRHISTVTDLLESRVPGLTTQRSSGAPGSAARILVRGVHSNAASNDPIIIVDGVRIGFDQSNQEQYVSPLDQIDVNSIETIEVLKGPSAASLYGTDAANGVIIIKTKRGQSGPPRWTFSASSGQEKLMGKYPEKYARWGIEPFTGQRTECLPNDLNCIVDSVSKFQWVNDPDVSPFGRGRTTQYSVGVSGGSSGLTYALSGSQMSQLGITKMPNVIAQRYQELSLGNALLESQRRPDRLNQQSGSVNLNMRLSEEADISVISSLTRSRRMSSGLNSAVSALTELGPISLDSLARLDIIPRAKRKDIANTASTFNGLNANWRPTSWLSTNASFGLNVNSNDGNSLLRRGDCPSSTAWCFQDSTGILTIDHVTSNTASGNIGGNVSWPINDIWSVRFATGVQVTKQKTEGFNSRGTDLVVGDNSLGSAGKTETKNSGHRAATGGVYVEGSFAAANLVYVSVGMRRDAGTSIGGQVAPVYPKWGVSLLPPESWLQYAKPWISSFRVRTAFGHAGVQPGPADKYRTYRQTSSYVDGAVVPVLNLVSLGNEQLRPERGVEFEGGPDIGFLNERVVFSVTKYRRMQRDAVYPQKIAASYGVGSTRFENIGTVLNTGTELSATIRAFDSPIFSWEMVLNAGWTKNEVKSVSATVRNDRNSPIRVGYPLFAVWAIPVLGYADADGNGILSGTEVLLGDEYVYAGAPYPKYSSGLQSNMTLLNRFRIGLGFSAQNGVTQQNLMNQGVNNPYAPLEVQAQGLANPFVYQTVSTLRFNSLSFGYDFPPALLRSLRMSSANIALQGTNLGLRTNYHGKDPDVNSTPRGLSLSDNGAIPQPRTWNLAVRLGL